MDTRVRLGLHHPPPSELQTSATAGTLDHVRIPALTVENMAHALNVETNTVLWIPNHVWPFYKLAGALASCDNSGTSEFFYFILFYLTFSL
jgi:hypothetical protein